jgi:RHS repeat-associated protein
MDRTSGEYYYIYDGLGSTRQLVNASGTVTDTYSYDAFGNLTSSPQLTPNPFLFNGQDMDGATGLIYLRARYMNPEDGRFLSQDLYAGRSADPISLHRYLYASDDPTVMEDPGGQDDGDIGSTMEACTESASLDGTGASATDAAEDAADDSISSSSSEETTSEEVESSDDPDESEEDEENNDGNIILFRGSSVGYPGNPSLQRMGMTPTSVDPVVSTLFATYSNQFEGTGIVMIIGSKDVGEAVIPNFDSTWPAEREMIVPLPPPAFEALVLLKGKIIPVGEAREILAGMGIGLPLSIINQTDLGNYISDHKFTTAEQAEQFAEEAGYEK